MRNKMGEKFYITTPLYYVNAAPHIGHSYTQIATDAIARFYRLKGYDVYFMTGTDEHGEKIARASREAGYKKGDEKRFIEDKILDRFKRLWEALDISYDHFIRTTDPDHERVVKRVLAILHDRGEIYEDEYDGWFCTPCETFWRRKQVEGNLCPDCNRKLEEIKEKDYFFKISKYQDWLIDHIQGHPDFIRPTSRRNEILGFLKNPLDDLCISRPKKRLGWGIEIPFDPDFVNYVWFDALINYISGCGYSIDDQRLKKWWPADVHIIGKDILRHHAVYWPIMLHALDLPPPRTIFAHGWWIRKGEKISKSRLNIIDPNPLIERFGRDGLRYFLLREVPFGLDGSFSEEALISRFNSDLANDLGNLLNRTIVMVEKYFDGRVPEPVEVEKELDRTLKTTTTALSKELDLRMKDFDLSGALASIFELVNASNKYIEDSAPWSLAKDGSRKAELANVIYNLLEAIRVLAIAVGPFMPETSKAMWSQLGIEQDLNKVKYNDIETWGLMRPGAKVKKARPLFPRIKC